MAGISIPEPIATEQVALDELRQLTSIQPRTEGLSDAQVESLASVNPAHWPPVKLSRRNGKMRLLAGAHRIAAAEKIAGVAALLAVVYEGLTEEQEYLLANRDNLSHGLPLSMADRRNYALWLKAKYPDMSLRQIAAEAHVSLGSVHNWLTVQNEQVAAESERHQLSLAERLNKLGIAFYNLWYGAVASGLNEAQLETFVQQQGASLIAAYEAEYQQDVATALRILGGGFFQAGQSADGGKIRQLRS